MEKVNFEVKVNFVFEYWAESNLIPQLSGLSPKDETTKISNDWFLKNLKLFRGVFTETIHPSVFQKHYFDCQGKETLKTPSGTFGLTGFKSEKQSKQILRRVKCHKFLIESFMKEI